MRFLVAFLIIVTLYATAFALDVDYSRGSGSITISGDFELNKIDDISYKKQIFNTLEVAECKVSGQPGAPQLPVYSKLIALPNSGNFTVDSFNFENEIIQLNKTIIPFGYEDDAELNTDYTRNDEWYPSQQVVISDPVIMRGIRFAQVAIYPLQYNASDNSVRILKDVDLKLSVDHSININENNRESEKPKGSFGKVARSGIVGTDICESDDTGTYLFICPDDAVEEITRLAKWKNKLGHKTRIATKSETGNTNTAIKNYLQNAYDNWEDTPEYVVLVGDVTGSFIIPTFYKEAYLGTTNETDHTYSLLDGSDYFPDVFIGRISIQNISQLTTVVNKLIGYEQTPYISNDWQTKALMCTYVNGEYVSGRETVLNVREKLLDYTYTVVDTFISPYQSGQTTLRNKINSGYSFVNYRGAGGPAYWVSAGGIMFEINDINQLNNGYMLPFVTGIVCGGGDFGSNGWGPGSGYENCFGETWLNAGNPALPKGGIGFIGPSEHDTKTPFNNANDMGIYQGITHENLHKGGEMLLRGKLELYNNYPNLHEWGLALDSDQFYFYVYNLLGDPGLAVWTDVPQNFDYSIVNSVETTSNHLEIQIDDSVQEKADFVVAITRTDETEVNELVAVGFTDENGNAVIPCEFVGEGFNVTVSKAGFIPKSYELELSESNNVGLKDFAINMPLIPNAEIQVIAQFENFSEEEITDINIDISCEANTIDLTTTNIYINYLPTNGSQYRDIYFDINEQWKDGFKTNLMVTVNSANGTQEYIIPLELTAPDLTYSSLTTSVMDELPQGGTLDINVELANNGTLPTGIFEVVLESMNDLVTVNTENGSYENIDSEEDANCLNNFQVTVNTEAIDGELASFKLSIFSDNLEVQEVYFTYPIGYIIHSSPTLSSYGYMGIESSDNIEIAPEYEWIGITPSEGGSGERIYGSSNTVDGFSDNIALPFSFQYFGEIYDRITVCSNGYISFCEKDFIFQRNRIIPSGVGPAGMIAPFWDNLYGGQLYVYSDEENHQFIVEWYNFRNNTNPNSLSTFQAILFDPAHYQTESGDGVIKFQYQEIHNVDYQNNYATVGIENYDQTDGVLIQFDDIDVQTANEVADETAILFTTSVQINTDAEEDMVNLPENTLTNYPNPFNPTTMISFSTELYEQNEQIEILIFNLKGQKIKSYLITTSTHSPINSVTWNGTDSNNNPVSSGIYFATMRQKGKILTSRKMLLLK